MRDVFIKTFGCKVNYTESVTLSDLLRQEGIPCSDLHGASLPTGSRAVVVVNSCCVTSEAERKAAQFIRRVKREHPDSDVLFTGCGARQHDSRGRYEELGAQVFGFYTEVFDWLKCELATADAAPLAADNKRRSRTFIKVQDGCHNCCGYCVIPYVRPYSSRPLGEIMAEVHREVERGTPELVLTGINIGHYGKRPLLELSESKQRPDPRAPLYEALPGHPQFIELVAQILNEFPATTRLRISSIEPEDIEPRLFELFQHPRMCAHLHLPLQSGSDAVLSAMRRRYGVAEYSAVARQFRAACPNGALTTDIITGFPTETEDDFQATLQLVSSLGFERVHGFPFSPRPETLAGELKQLPRAERLNRNRRLIEYAKAVADQRWQRFVGEEIEVVLENSGEDYWTGHGPAYQVVRVTGPVPDLSLVPVRLEGYSAGEFSGRVLS